MSGRTISGRWVRATWAGWLLGIPIIIVLALAGEAAGVGGSQAIVGAGMGLGIGLVQARVVRGMVSSAAHWVWSCAVGLAVPFLVTDIADAVGAGLPYSLQLSVLVGGILAGAWQALLLRVRFGRTGAWVAASAVGWALAAGAVGIADRMLGAQSIRGIPGALAYLGAIAAGGLVLGVATAAPLARLPRREPVAREHAGSSLLESGP